MSYEMIETIDLCDFADELIEDDIFLYEGEIKGMRPLDYAPDMDDYEYMQSILYR